MREKKINRLALAPDLPPIPAPVKSTVKRRDTLREELCSREYIKEILDIAKYLELDCLGREQISAARARADIYFRLLNKTLPDLKAESALIDVGLEKSIEKQAEVVIQAMVTGRITPDEGVNMLDSMGIYSRLVEFGSLLNRINALEGVKVGGKALEAK